MRLTELSVMAEVRILLFKYASSWPHLAGGGGSGEARLIYDPDTGTLTSLKATVYDCLCTNTPPCLLAIQGQTLSSSFVEKNPGSGQTGQSWVAGLWMFL